MCSLLLQARAAGARRDTPSPIPRSRTSGRRGGRGVARRIRVIIKPSAKTRPATCAGRQVMNARHTPHNGCAGQPSGDPPPTKTDDGGKGEESERTGFGGGDDLDVVE